MPERLRLAVLSSRRSPGLAELLVRAERSGLYEITCLLTSEEAFADRGIAERAALPWLVHPIRAFCERRGTRFGDLSARRDYDAVTIRLLRPFAPDALLLSGYLLIATEPLLAGWPDRIVNVHGADLARTGTDGRPLYPGLRAVRDAICAGENETRATAHIVTERLDDGPILLRSPAFPVAPFVRRLREGGFLHAVNAYAFAHQEWMLASAWGTLLAGSAEILSAAGLLASNLAEDAELVLPELA